MLLKRETIIRNLRAIRRTSLIIENKVLKVITLLWEMEKTVYREAPIIAHTIKKPTNLQEATKVWVKSPTIPQKWSKMSHCIESNNYFETRTGRKIKWIHLQDIKITTIWEAQLIKNQIKMEGNKMTIHPKNLKAIICQSHWFEIKYKLCNHQKRSTFILILGWKWLMIKSEG